MRYEGVIIATHSNLPTQPVRKVKGWQPLLCYSLVYFVCSCKHRIITDILHLGVLLLWTGLNQLCLAQISAPSVLELETSKLL